MRDLGKAGEKRGAVQDEEIRQAIATGKPATFTEIAESLGLPEEKVLQALEGHQSFRADAIAPAELLETLKAWGRLRLTVRSSGAVVELLATLAEGWQSGQYLNLETEQYHFHLRVPSLARAYFVEKQGHPPGSVSYSVQFFDTNGDCVLKAFLIRSASGEVSAEQLEAFHQAKARYCKGERGN